MSIRNNKVRRRRIRRALIAHYGPHCMRCDPEKQKVLGGFALTIDHVVPLREGGADDESNLQLLCVRCHRLVDDTREDGRHPEAKHDYRPLRFECRGPCLVGDCDCRALHDSMVVSQSPPLHEGCTCTVRLDTFKPAAGMADCPEKRALMLHPLSTRVDS